MSLSPTSAEFFESMYAGREDPWAFASSQYERDRYAAILRALGRRRYSCAFEPGCSIGILTEQLAKMCDLVYAADISPTAVARARVRCEHLPNVQLSCGSLLNMIPDAQLDLIVFSEIGYYFNETQLRALSATLTARMRIESTFLAAHWLGTSQDHLLHGDCVHDVLNGNPHLDLVQSERYAGFRLDRWIVA